jgi:hypothetical protein
LIRYLVRDKINYMWGIILIWQIHKF